MRLRRALLLAALTAVAALAGITLLLGLGLPRLPLPLAQGDAGSEARAARLEVPWPQAAPKNVVFFNLRHNRVQFLDLRPFYSALQDTPVDRKGSPLTFTQRQLTLRFFPVTNQVFCLELKPDPAAGETWTQAQLPGSHLRKVLQQFSSAGYAYFFWVGGDSFETYTRVRAWLREQRVEVLWRPVAEGAPLEACSGLEGFPGLPTP